MEVNKVRAHIIIKEGYVTSEFIDQIISKWGIERVDLAKSLEFGVISGLVLEADITDIKKMSEIEYVRLSEIKRIQDNRISDLHNFIRNAHSDGSIAAILGDVLEKTAVLIITINPDGSIDSHANNRSDVETAKRDRSMVIQMSELLKKNMGDMMKKAGKEYKE